MIFFFVHKSWKDECSKDEYIIHVTNVWSIISECCQGNKNLNSELVGKHFLCAWPETLRETNT